MSNFKVKYTNWNEISIEKYYKIEEIRNENLDTHNGVAKLLAVLCDVSENDIMKLTISEINKLYAQCGFMTEPIQVKDVKLNALRIGNNKYKIETDLSKYTVAQFIDYNAYAKNPQHCIAEILSTIIIPEGKKYNEEYEIEDVINDIEENLNIVTAISLFNGLKKKFNKYVEHTLQSLQMRLKIMEKIPMKKEKKNLIKTLKEKIKTIL